jgi:preprotein translocase subunit SecG
VARRAGPSSVAPTARAPTASTKDPAVLTGAVVVVHVLVSLILIMLILLKSGRGGGLSDMFGGGSMSQMSGSTVVEKNLDRMTVVIGVIFAVTTIVLALRLA